MKWTRAALLLLPAGIAFGVLVSALGGELAVARGFVNGPTMKPALALSLLMACGVVHLTTSARCDLSEFDQVGMLALIAGIVTTMGSAWLLGHGVLDPSVEFTRAPGEPSAAAAVACGLIIASGLFQLIGPPVCVQARKAGWSVVVIGACAIVGYVLGVPALYFYLPWSSGLALPSAVCLVFLGLLLAFGRELRSGVE